MTTSPDARAARLAAGQWSVLTIHDLRACGFTYSAVKVRVARGVLHPLYRSVYAWGHHNIPTEGRWLAAVKACGPYAVLSHYSAAALHDLVKWDGRPFEITAPSKHSHPRIKAHRSASIERTIVKGIPVTPKLRTVIDLATAGDEETTKRALRAAKFDADQLAQVADRERQAELGAAGERVLRVRKSELASRPDRFLARLRAAGVPDA